MSDQAQLIIRYPWLKQYIQINPQQRSDLYRYYALKRAIDLVTVILASPVWLPIFIMIACIIKLSDFSAPVFFKQKRNGYGGRTIYIYKFRSMVKNAEELKLKYADLNELKWPDFKITNDPRVTKIGRFLRRTSLDELPQLINVLKNDMTLVGPRPATIAIEKYQTWQTYRLTVKPGMTGLWQITGRGKVFFDDRTRLDVFYIQHKCTRLDLEILFRTIYYVIKKEGAV